MKFPNLNQARELKARLDKLHQIQKALSDIVIEADAGRGAVRVTMNGQMQLKSVKIAPELVSPDKAKNLEELVQKAVNDAIDKTRKEATKELKELAGGNIPGLF
ncbi:MAG: YbaB/EbfC family nucleoid-associated protein [Chloroflexota bacterium]